MRLQSVVNVCKDATCRDGKACIPSLDRLWPALFLIPARRLSASADRAAVHLKGILGVLLCPPVRDQKLGKSNFTSGLRERVIAAAIDDLYSHQLSSLGTKQQCLKACVKHLKALMEAYTEDVPPPFCRRRTRCLIGVLMQTRA